MTTMAEAEWDDATRDLALAHTQRAGLCPSCGGPAYLCQDPDLAHAWDVPPPVRCHRTTALREKQRAVTEETNPIPEALLWGVVLNDDTGGGHGG